MGIHDGQEERRTHCCLNRSRLAASSCGPGGPMQRFAQQVHRCVLHRPDGLRAASQRLPRGSVVDRLLLRRCGARREIPHQIWRGTIQSEGPRPWLELGAVVQTRSLIADFAACLRAPTAPVIMGKERVRIAQRLQVCGDGKTRAGPARGQSMNVSHKSMRISLPNRLARSSL
jgi:hypothetical protein